MTTLQAKSVYHQPADVPQNLLIWQDENSGIAALVLAAQDITEGKRVTFALCDRQGTLQPTVEEVVTIAMGSNRTPRYCGEDNDPDGVGSYALIASWYDYAADPAYIAVAMARAFQAHKCYFRLL
jgi:hypothetical protein